MPSLRARVWLGLLTAVAAGLVAWTVHDQPQTSWPAPGALASSHASVDVSVTQDADVATFHIHAPNEVEYGVSFDIDQWTADHWVNRLTGSLVEGSVAKPFRPKKEMFWPAVAPFGPRDVPIDISGLSRGTYRLRTALNGVELAATFTVN